MDSASLSNNRPFRKDDVTFGGIASLDSLNIKLHALACIATHAVRDHPNDVDMFHTLSGIAELLQAASAQSDQIDSSQIAADVAAMIAKSRPTE